MTTLLITAPALGHTFPDHPEHSGRVPAIMQKLEQHNILSDLHLLPPASGLVGQVRRVHTEQLISHIRYTSLHGGGRLDADTYCTLESYDLALQAVGACCQGVDEIMSGRVHNGMVLVRPPGHHAEKKSFGGFCLFNNIAAAARHAQINHGLQRVLILDFDVHHGNGTQDIFYDDPSVLFISTHLYTGFFYPGTGSARETGIGLGLGYTLNVPFPPGVGDNGYAQVFTELIRPAVAAFQPEFILISAGYDAHWADPLASAGLSLTGYAHLSRTLVQMADEWCRGRILFILEGGYFLEALAGGALNSLYALCGRDQIHDPLGPPRQSEANVTDLLYALRQLHFSGS
ncbi:MAG: histone deacetylase [Anaerolineae bacterium]|nr:histone deacetylase [Anaerolineae bacterium]